MEKFLLLMTMTKNETFNNNFFYPIPKKLDLPVWGGKGNALLSQVQENKKKRKSNNTKIQKIYDRHSPSGWSILEIFVWSFDGSNRLMLRLTIQKR